MPPARRAGKAARSQQSTLSFGNQSRVTKSSVAPPSHLKKPSHPEPDVPSRSKKPSLEAVSEQEQTPRSPTEPSQPHVAELAVRQQAQAEIQQPWTDDDRRATKLTEKDLQRYWKNEESKRRGPSVHHQDLSLHEKILRHFDLSSQYGPCIGIARMKRWRRANALNLHPPIEVLAVLLKQPTEKNQRAYVDELMS
ncbi:DNA polymerase delta, subunit 4-domain-containing protein [Aspergillus ambiguus]|uniref:putative DNA polymerase delta subunit 4 n=1 Tax=Aspergillus ambiguus TaxID=176160 RepID=UPI003CCDE6AB